MTNTEIIHEILDSISEINRVEREHDIKHGIDPDAIARSFGEGGFERFAEINQPKVDILELIAALPKAQAVSIITIMYYGRDGADSIQALKQHCAGTFPDSKIIASQIMGKRNALPQYFNDAFKSAKAKNIDLDKI